MSCHVIMSPTIAGSKKKFIHTTKILDFSPKNERLNFERFSVSSKAKPEENAQNVDGHAGGCCKVEKASYVASFILTGTQAFLKAL